VFLRPERTARTEARHQTKLNGVYGQPPLSVDKFPWPSKSPGSFYIVREIQHANAAAAQVFVIIGVETMAN
jgi:hypothetical protein